MAASKRDYGRGARRDPTGAIRPRRPARPAEPAHPARRCAQGVAEVKEGMTFCLSLPLDYPGGNVLNPRRHPPVLRADAARRRARTSTTRCARTIPNATDVICDDVVVLHAAVLDAVGQPRARRAAVRRRRRRQARAGLLQRLSRRRATSSGRPTARRRRRRRRAASSRRSAEALGIENMAEHGVQGRGVMIDLHAHFGRERRVVGYDELMRVHRGGQGRSRGAATWSACTPASPRCSSR